MNIIQKFLFKTEAIKIAPENKPFWYTSGTIGPYFINTHYLFGGEKKANELLNFIDENINKPDFTLTLTDRIISFLEKDLDFKNVIMEFYNSIKNNKNFIDSYYISGGERRDWFFSVPVSYISKKPHLFIFKDLRVFEDNKEVKDIDNKKVTHIADLVTQASSYERGWIPAIKSINGDMIFTASIVDRNQGGKEFFNKMKIDFFASVVIDNVFFDLALKNNIINIAQFELIKEFNKSPNFYGKSFILNNVNFLIESINSNDKSIKTKAERCIKENPYKINFEKIL